MSTYKTMRGKLVSLGRIQLIGGNDGSLDILVGDEHLHILEEEASALYDLMGDLMSWDSSAGATESSIERLAGPDDGRADDPRALDARH